MRRAMLSPADTFTMDVDPRADFCETTERVDDVYVRRVRYIRREIAQAREGPVMLTDWPTRLSPLFGVVFVRDQMPLDEETLWRAANAVWPCDCGCMAE